MAISAYVWVRFDWQFAAGAILSLVHDVIVVAGIFAVFQLEFDLSIVAALLTVLGYSVNDTVVISDRIRENLRRYKKMPIDKLINTSINETLSRTFLTGLTTVVVLVALLVFGGDVLFNFSLAMLLGVLIGSYSSVFLAAPLLGYLGVRRDILLGSGANDFPVQPEHRHHNPAFAPPERPHAAAAEQQDHAGADSAKAQGRRHGAI